MYSMQWDLDYSYHYNKFHNDSPAHVEWQVAFNQRILERYLPEEHTTPALEIGCGMGFAMLYLIRAGFSPVEGIDIDPQQVKSCRDKGLTVHHIDDAVQFVAQRQAYYGLVLAMDLLEHLPPDQQIALARTIYQSLIPGGRLICSAPNANSTLASRQRYIDFTHHASFTEYSLDFLLHNAGFRNIEVTGYEFYQPPHRKGLGPGDFARRRNYVTFTLRDYMRWFLRGVVRGWRRLEMVAELGSEVGRSVPLSLNLLGVAVKE